MLNVQPTLQTPRLVLRPFCLKDAPVVQQLAGAREIAATTLNIPHPYEKGMAEEFIVGLEAEWSQERCATFAITSRESGAVVGCMRLTINQRFNHAALGYWIGVPFWGQGFATEAGRAILKFGFQTLKLHRIYASSMVGNDASGRVQEKLGMKTEGRLRDHYFKWGQPRDAHLRGILNSEWKNKN